MNLILIGYWVNKSKYMFDSTKKYADPSKLQDKSFWETKNKNDVISYLESGTRINFQKGWSNCRICGSHLGSSEVTDGTYAWPQQMEHYIKEHDIKIPDEFYEHIVNNLFKIPAQDENAYSYRKLNEAPWIEWSKNYLTDFIEKPEDTALRARSMMENRPMIVQETIERGANDIQKEIDDEILRDFDKKYSKGIKNG